MINKIALACGVLCLNMMTLASALSQTATNIVVLKGLAPLTVLQQSTGGRAALAANFTVTGGIQIGDEQVLRF
jgi:hypothetical protein